MNNEVRVLVLSPFNYVYGSKEISYWCGDFFYLNPSSKEEDLEELKFILESSYLWKGWIYLEESIKEDFKNKQGLFSPSVILNQIPSVKETIDIEEEQESPLVEEEVLSQENQSSPLLKPKKSSKTKSPSSDN